MIVLFLGVPEMGKTQAAMDYVNAHALTHRFFAVCRAGDWQQESCDEYGQDRWRGLHWAPWERQSYRERIYRACRIQAPQPERRAWFDNAPDPGSTGRDNEGNIVFDPQVMEWARSLPENGLFRFGYPWEGDHVAELVKRVGGTTYVDDEIDLTALHGGWQTNPLRDFCHRGRHMPNEQNEIGKIHILGAARQVQSLHPDMTNLASVIFVFRLQGWRTLTRVVDEGIVDKSEIEIIRNLAPYHYKQWNPSRPASWGTLAPL